jgi:hypothetical protein
MWNSFITDANYARASSEASRACCRRVELLQPRRAFHAFEKLKSQK